MSNKMIDINEITRKNILEMKPYSSARDDYKGNASVWLDANENPNNTNLNRYPDPKQLTLKNTIAEQKKVTAQQIFIGNGSDEAIDLLVRAFCEPNESKVITFPPTYGMYKVAAQINNIEIIELPLSENFELPDLEIIKSQCNQTGLLFICSPNNPTGNSFDPRLIKEISIFFKGLVVIDEAYIDFSEQESNINLINEIPNLVILQTLSKAYGLAGARIGMAFANEKIISVLNKIKPPYNINTLSMNAAIEVLKKQDFIKAQINELKLEKEKMAVILNSLELVIKVYPSDSNFLLVQFKNSDMVFKTLIQKGIVVRNRRHEVENCLRITIGTQEENTQLVKTLNTIQS